MKKVYTVIIDDGLRSRAFANLSLLCELFSLDYANVNYHLKNKGYWAGLRYAIFLSEMETSKAHKGRER